MEPFTIYAFSVLESLRIAFLFLLFASIVVILLIAGMYFDTSFDGERNIFKKLIKYAVTVLLVCSAGLIVIPNKEEQEIIMHAISR